MAGRIVVADGDPSSAHAQFEDLKALGYAVERVDRGDSVLEMIRRRAAVLLLLSLSLPGEPDPLTLCRRLQQCFPRTLVMGTTTHDGPGEQVRALRAGADEVIALPIGRDELDARVEALLRRMKPAVEAVRLGTAIIDFRRQTATSGSSPVFLTNREFEVLRSLAAREGGVVTREELLEFVWGCSPKLLTRTVDNCMLRLRRKLEPDPHRPEFIRKAYGDGYRLLATEWRHSGEPLLAVATVEDAEAVLGASPKGTPRDTLELS